MLVSHRAVRIFWKSVWLVTLLVFLPGELPSVVLIPLFLTFDNRNAAIDRKINETLSFTTQQRPFYPKTIDSLALSQTRDGRKVLTGKRSVSAEFTSLHLKSPAWCLSEEIYRCRPTCHLPLANWTYNCPHRHT